MLNSLIFTQIERVLHCHLLCLQEIAFYRNCHLKIQNDIAASMNSGEAVTLTLLDHTAAFYNTDHNILFDYLRGWFRVDGTVSSWMKSYLTNGKQKVKLGNRFSDAVSLPYGVPQGSVLGPLIFTLSLHHPLQ